MGFGFLEIVLIEFIDASIYNCSFITSYNCSINGAYLKMWHKENHCSMYSDGLRNPSRVDPAHLTWHMESML